MSLFEWDDEETSLEQLARDILAETAYYDPALWTYGSEWEKADIPRNIALPKGLEWDYKDQTVMNSNGVATDPGKSYANLTCKFGGEMNTKPCDTIDELAALHDELLNVCNGQIAVNNSCNLHNHIRVPDIDLLGLKKIVAYYYLYRSEIASVSDYIPTPEEQGYTINTHKQDELDAVEKRYKHHTQVTRHGIISDTIVRAKLEATTEDEFHSCGGLFGALGDKQPNGNNCSLWSNHPRGGINTIQMRKRPTGEYAESGTIEFRMHHGTNDTYKFKNTLLWDSAIMNAALNTSETPTQLFSDLFGTNPRESVLPEYINFDARMYLDIFSLTKHGGSNKKKDIEQNIVNLKNAGKI